VAAILANPRYTGRQVWNRQRTDFDLVDPANTGLGHKPVQRWNLPEGWVISRRPAHPAIISEAAYIAAHDATAPRGPAGPPAHPALVSEADFIAAQDINAARGPAPRAALAAPDKRRYLLAGLLACGRCGRRLESAWSNGKPAYRCRHGHTSATGSSPDRPANLYVREDHILPRLAALAILQSEGSHPPARQETGQRPGHGAHAGRGADRPPAGRRRHAHLRPGHAGPADGHREFPSRHCRLGNNPPASGSQEGGQSPGTAPATAAGRARVTIPHARKQAVMGN